MRKKYLHDNNTHNYLHDDNMQKRVDIPTPTFLFLRDRETVLAKSKS